MRAFIEQCCAEESDRLKHLLAKSDVPWTVSEEFSSELEVLAERLAEHYMRRAFLFGDYRVNGNDNAKTLKKAPVSLKESDLYMAWETIKQDCTL